MRPSPESIEKLVRIIVEAVQPRRIILFGSAPRGEMRPDSDMDVLVVVPEETHQRRAAQAVYRHLIGFSHPVDVVVATESDLAAHGSNFTLVYYPALREGKEIYAV